MTPQEKRAWIMLVVSAVVYAVYVAVILNRADGHELAATRTRRRCCGRRARALWARWLSTWRWG
jgi:hypothetical protein